MNRELNFYNQELTNDILIERLEDEDLSHLELLRVTANRLTRLPSNLPNTLVYLFCSENQITKLPASLPTSLKYLQCDHNQLTELPALPNLILLGCNNNNITHLPILPDSLEYLDYTSNPIEQEPFLPYKLKMINYKDATSMKLKQYNLQRQKLYLPSVDTMPTLKEWKSIMNPHTQISRAFDISLALSRSGLNPLAISHIVDWDRQLDELPFIPALEVNQMLPAIEHLVNYTSRDDQGKMFGNYVEVPEDIETEKRGDKFYKKVKMSKRIL